MIEFRPFGTRPGAVQLTTNYQRLPGGSTGQPVIVTWMNTKVIALTTLSQTSPIVPSTHLRRT